MSSTMYCKSVNMKLMNAEKQDEKSTFISLQRNLLQGDDDGDDIETLCVECFNFLKALIKDHFEVQTRWVYFPIFNQNLT